MAAKTQSESTRAAPPHRTTPPQREISGILLLAGGLFAGLALASEQIASAPAMGPGGARDRVGAVCGLGDGRLSAGGGDAGRVGALLPRPRRWSTAFARGWAR
jgi:hypothetical protein